MKVLITGAAGFIGSRIVSAVRSHGHQTAALARQGIPELAVIGIGDLLSISHLHLDGVDVVIHAASRTAGADEQLWRDNVAITGAVAAAAMNIGARLMYISTTGVYGRSAGVFTDPSSTPRAPKSTLSKARAAAEDIIFGAGGTVLRPHIVHGDGDRWVAPRLAEFMHVSNAWVGSKDIHVAAISVVTLGEIVARLLDCSLPPVLHAADPDPLSVRTLVAPIFHARGWQFPSRTMSLDEARRTLARFGVSAGAVEMVGADSRMESDSLWSLIDPASRLVSEPAALAALELGRSYN